MSAVMEQVAPKSTNLAELRAPGAPESRMPVVRMGFGDLQGFELMQRAAKALAASTLVPAQFQGNLPNCIIALEMANRIGASPLMVVQNLYVVHGRPGWSAKFLIASFNQCGRFTSLRYAWQGKQGQDDWGCRAWATEKATGEKIEGPLITIALAKREGWDSKSGSKWKTIPELMLTYRAAAWLVNTHAPEISMGLNTSEELGDVYEAAPDGAGGFAVTTDDLRGAAAAVNAGVIDGETGEIKDEKSEVPAAAVTSVWDDFKDAVAKAAGPEQLDYCRGLLKELNDEHAAEGAELISKRAGEIAAGSGKPKK